MNSSGLTPTGTQATVFSNGGAPDDQAYEIDIPLTMSPTSTHVGSFAVNATAGNFTLTGTNNLKGTTATPLNAKLGPLASNGGPTQTHLPNSDSPVVDKGSNPSNLTTEQRGAGFSREVGGGVDRPRARRQMMKSVLQAMPEGVDAVLRELAPDLVAERTVERSKHGFRIAKCER